MKTPYFSILHVIRLIKLKVSKILFRSKIFSDNVVLGYAPGNRIDGLGAQLQRVLAINALADFWRLRVIHPVISQIAVHPLDQLNDENSYNTFLDEVNRIIGTETVDSKFLNTYKSFYAEDLKFRHISKLLFNTIIFRRKTFLHVTHPYYFVDANVMMYICDENLKIAEKLKSLAAHSKIPKIALHHRQGVGNMAVQPGQSFPRELALSEYIRPLSESIELTQLDDISVYTDAPESKLTFTPPKDQQKSWSGLPNFDGLSMEINAKDFTFLSRECSYGIEVIRGGNPLLCLAELSCATALILSRSSFGYVAALLGQQTLVWTPKDFWHPPLPWWRKF